MNTEISPNHLYENINYSKPPLSFPIFSEPPLYFSIFPEPYVIIECMHELDEKLAKVALRIFIVTDM